MSAANLSMSVTQADWSHSDDWTARARQGDALLLRLAAARDAVREKQGAPGQPAGAHPTVIVAPCEGARRAILFFPGNVTILSLPTVLFDYPETHIIIVRDPRRCFCLSGVPGLGDTLDECQAMLRDILQELGDPTLFVMGASAGGYAALRYALDLNASGVLALSAPTTLDIRDDPEGSTKKYPQLANLYRRNRELGLDLVPLYRERCPRPRVIMVHTPSHERDRWLSERIKGLDGVDHIEAPEKAGHRVLLYLNEQQQLGMFVDCLCALKPFSRPVAVPMVPQLAVAAVAAQ